MTGDAPQVMHRPNPESCRPRGLAGRQQLIVWGWLRLALGVAQIALSIWAVVLIVKIGLQPKTGVVIGIGFIALAVSRWLYRGRKASPRPR
jgi:hypothetical protein